jgi:hypothetical protein
VWILVKDIVRVEWEKGRMLGELVVRVRRVLVKSGRLLEVMEWWRGLDKRALFIDQGSCCVTRILSWFEV